MLNSKNILFLILFFNNTNLVNGKNMKNYKVIDLTHEVNSTIPTWDLTCGFLAKNVCDYDDCKDDFKFRVNRFDMIAGIGTHMDSPAHCFKDAKCINDFEVKELIAPCIVIDVSDKMNENYKVSIADIEMFEKKHGEIKSGTFVIFYTGWSTYWNDTKKYHNNYLFPSISPEVAKLLLTRQIVGIGIDTLSPDSGGKEFFVHSILLGANKFIVENVANADKLPPLGSTVFVMPLKLKGATESPIRLIALV